MPGPGRITFSGTYLSSNTSDTVSWDELQRLAVRALGVAPLEEVEPTCDICSLNESDGGMWPGDWNGETGCHQSCEEARDEFPEPEPDNPLAACECYSCTAEAELALAHTLRRGGPVHAMTCIPCAASEYAGVPHMDMRYETYWSM